MAQHALWPQIEAAYRSEFARFTRVARAVTGDQETALVAVQEGFADALRNAGQWKGAGPLEGWVWRCVVNGARKARSTPHTLPPSHAVTNGRASEGSQSELLVRFAALPERALPGHRRRASSTRGRSRRFRRRAASAGTPYQHIVDSRYPVSNRLLSPLFRVRPWLRDGSPSIRYSGRGANP